MGDGWGRGAVLTRGRVAEVGMIVVVVVVVVKVCRGWGRRDIWLREKGCEDEVYVLV